MALMDFEYLIKSEKVTSSSSSFEDANWFNEYPNYINTFFNICYYTGNSEDPESAEGMFLTFSHSHYLKIPYSLRAAMILLEKGYYAESALIVRNLFETLVQLRYFHLHKDKLNNYVTKNKKIPIRQMLIEFNDNLYKTAYSVLSTIAHAEFGATVFRSQYTSPSDGRAIMGSVYNKKFYYFILNQLSAIIYGLLNFVPVFFLHYIDLVPVEIEKQRTISLESLRTIINSDPKSEEFIKDILPLVEYKNLVL